MSPQRLTEVITERNAEIRDLEGEADLLRGEVGSMNLYVQQLKDDNAALTAEVERLRQSWTELRDAMVDMDRDCEDDLFENPSEALACCIELMDSIVTIEPKDRPDA